MTEDDIARLLQNAEFENILPGERNVGGINMDKQQVKDTAQDNISILAWLSSLDSISGQYGGLGMITRPVWKCPCINLYII
jgi:hypothetical protein